MYITHMYTHAGYISFFVERATLSCPQTYKRTLAVANQPSDTGPERLRLREAFECPYLFMALAARADLISPSKKYGV